MIWFLVSRPTLPTRISVGSAAARQQGSNENFNAMLRQYIPKKRRIETVTVEELIMIENGFNHRPRKPLGFKSPQEAFHASLNRVAPLT